MIHLGKRKTGLGGEVPKNRSSGKLAAAAFLLILLTCVAPLFGSGFGGKALADGENLLANGSFEENDGETPAGWEENCWTNEEGFTVFSVDPAGGTDGGAAACIENFELNDSRFMQKVPVEAGKLYRLSGDIKVERGDGSWGATLSFVDTFTYTGPLLDTGGEWKHVEVYARAGAGQSSTTVFARLGGYGSTCHGKAWFDNVVFEEVDSLPESASELSMATNKPSSPDKPANDESKYLPYIILIALAFAAFMLWAFRHVNDIMKPAGGFAGFWLYALGAVIAGGFSAYTAIGQISEPLSQIETALLIFAFMIGFGCVPAAVILWIKNVLAAKDRHWADVAFVAYVAIVVRIGLAISVRGYPNDIDCWLGWSSQTVSGGLFNIYSTAGFNDYPPGYMYVLWFVGLINSVIPVPNFQLLMVKLPAILADIGTAYFIYRIASERFGNRAAALLAALYAFNPLVLIDSSAWGQIDSVLALIAVACFWQVYKNNMGWAAMLYGVGLLVKPQMLLFAPVMLAALINLCRRAGSAEKGILLFLKTIGIGLGTVIGLALPFWISQVVHSLNPSAIEQGQTLGQALLWLPNQYLNSLGTYKNASINACNLLAFFGGNWVSDSEKMFGVPYYVWGYAGMALVSIYVFCMQVLRDKDNRRIFLWAAVLISGLFVLGLRMHERYMFPALALLLVYYVLERDRRALYLFGMFTITQFLNVAIVLANEHMSTDVLQLGAFSIANPGSFGIWVFLISLGAVAAFAYMVYASAKADRSLLYSGPNPEEQALARQNRIRDDLAVSPEASRIPMKRKDWLLMGALTLVYAAIALVYLGDAKVPQTMWDAARTGDYATIDFGRTVDIDEIWHYDGLTKGNFTLSTSEDGENWTDQLEFYHKATPTGGKDDLGIYRWTIDSKKDEDDNLIVLHARYVRLTVTAPTVRLLEIAFKDTAGNTIVPVSVSDAGGEDKALAANIIDEQSLVPLRPSFMNSMYFDEIYHARTGWEFTQGNLQPYENTHPPLGKDLIALGILIFGMDPFGWRFMGTLMGILMVPAMYFFGMAVFKKTRYAFITAFLFTFDFMHFVQTRIATIDSYSVLFIMLTFLCMYLYLNKNFNTQKLRGTFLPLGLSGVFFGLASASKWIGLYAGAGLALMFFYSLYRRFVEYRAVKAGEAEVDEEIREKVLRRFWLKFFATLGFCVVFFIIIPGVIYFASYIPFDRGMGGGKVGVIEGLRYAWDNQSSMYNYHSNLVDNHFFKSPWYQWPFIIKPMWWYDATNLPAGEIGCISTFGNPAVWWLGTAALAWLVLRIYKNRKFELPDIFVLVGFLTEFLPWVLIARSMFIYHYFASVPFFVMAIVLYIRQWEERREPGDRNAQMQVIIALAAALIVGLFMSVLLSFLLAIPLVICMAMYWRQTPLELYRKDLTHIYLGIVLALFILFYPVLSGLPIPLWYEKLLKWMPTWWFTNIG